MYGDGRRTDRPADVTWEGGSMGGEDGQRRTRVARCWLSLSVCRFVSRFRCDDDDEWWGWRREGDGRRGWNRARWRRGGGGRCTGGSCEASRVRTVGWR